MEGSLSAAQVRKTMGLNEVIQLLKDPPGDCLHAPPQHPKGSQVFIVRLADSSAQGIEKNDL